MKQIWHSLAGLKSDFFVQYHLWCKLQDMWLQEMMYIELFRNPLTEASLGCSCQIALKRKTKKGTILLWRVWCWKVNSGNEHCNKQFSLLSSVQLKTPRTALLKYEQDNIINCDPKSSVFTVMYTDRNILHFPTPL